MNWMRRALGPLGVGRLGQERRLLLAGGAPRSEEVEHHRVVDLGAESVEIDRGPAGERREGEAGGPAPDRDDGARIR